MQNTRSQGGDLIQRINEIECFINVKRRACNLPEVAPIPINHELTFTDQINQITPKLEMAALRPLRDYVAPSRAEPHSSIAPPAIEANNFELKPSLVQVSRGKIVVFFLDETPDAFFGLECSKNDFSFVRTKLFIVSKRGKGKKLQ